MATSQYPPAPPSGVEISTLYQIKVHLIANQLEVAPLPRLPGCVFRWERCYQIGGRRSFRSFFRLVVYENKGPGNFIEHYRVEGQRQWIGAPVLFQTHCGATEEHQAYWYGVHNFWAFILRQALPQLTPGMARGLAWWQWVLHGRRGLPYGLTLTTKPIRPGPGYDNLLTLFRGEGTSGT